ncbi:hypothetical protein [Paracidovorax konjaci]|uniref:hypothetical protein n=1 Tax=Paracidovorax konjaci TaxID=32040 RepID=UPI0011134DE0|nr:hypothetical protein [Paracidovorax konjaci]
MILQRWCMRGGWPCMHVRQALKQKAPDGFAIRGLLSDARFNGRECGDLEVAALPRIQARISQADDAAPGVPCIRSFW